MPPKIQKALNKAGKTVAGKSKPSAKPRAPLLPAERLKRLFTSLYAQIDGGYLTNAVKTCDKILRIDPADSDALQTKLFLLLQTEQYTAALSFIDSKSESEKVYEKAYSLYRLQREDEANEVLEPIKSDAREDRGISHLDAQIAYRSGNYTAAVDLYTQLLDTAEPQSEEQSDILTNLQASQQHVDFLESGYLRSLDSLSSAVVSGLESAPAPTQAQPSASAAAPTVSSATPAAEPVKKTVRTKRVPKGVVPGVTPPPDPERWLKKNERSTFVQKKGRGNKGGAHQGVTVEPAAVAGPISGGGVTGGGKSGKGKKKK